MSREIKYRVWDEGEKEYIDGLFLLAPDGKLYEKIDDFHFLERSPDRYIVEQYTGLKDKNGKMIMEGDIVKTNSPDQPNFKAGVIEFAQRAFWISNVPSDRPDHTHSELLLQYWETKIEIIGNVHENPELLGGDMLTKRNNFLKGGNMTKQ